MGIMIDTKPQYYGEQKVWEAFENYLPDEVVVYNSREVSGKEYDFCLLIKNMGILIVEVKGWQPNGIRVDSADKIFLSNDKKYVHSPKKQARTYRFCMKNKLNKDLGFTPLIMDMVCYPFISKKEYQDLRLDVVSEEENTILKDDLMSMDKLMNKISQSYELLRDVPHTYFSYEKVMKVRNKMEPQLVINDDNHSDTNPYSKLIYINDEIQDAYILDIINGYYSGIKYIIFTNIKDNYLKIINSFYFSQKEKNINIKRNVTIGTEEIDDSYQRKNYFEVFNFQIHLLSNIPEKINKSFEINEGKVSEIQDEILIYFSKESRFNYQQYKIEHADSDKNILIEAGAGTGKTFSMVNRIAFLCNRRKHSIQNITEDLAMITFTNAAADNMKSRLKQMFINYFTVTRDNTYLNYIEDLSRTNISTIHKFVIELLRKSPVYTGLGINFKISSNDFLREQIYNEKLAEFINNKSIESFKELPVNIYELRKTLINFCNVLLQKSLNIFDISYSQLGYPQNNIVPYMNDLIEYVIKPSEKEYKESLKFENKMNLESSIVELKTVLKATNENVFNLKFKYIFIDEFQDTDDIQISLFQQIQKLIGANCKFFIVGDLKQSIYRFRGATMSAFDLMKSSTLNKWEKYYINKNYRTNKYLLQDFDSIFKRLGENGNIPYQEQDSLSSDIVDTISDNRLTVVDSDSTDMDVYFDDIEKIVHNQIEILQANRKATTEKRELTKEYNTIALLVRTNSEVSMIKNQLLKRNIYVEVESTGNLFQLPSTQDLYKLLQALVYSRDNSRLINFFQSNYIKTNMDFQIFYKCSEQEIQSIIYKELNNYFEKTMNCSFEDILNDIYTKPILYVLKSIYDHLAPWKQVSSDINIQQNYMANYSYLIERIVKYSNIDNLTINQILEYLRINIVTGQSFPSREKNEKDNNIKIICSTIHKSKGLEYGTVILPFTNRNLIGTLQSGIDAGILDNKLFYKMNFKKRIIEFNDNYDQTIETNEQIKEEARVLYVALTRSIRNCIWVRDLGEHPQNCWDEMLGE